MQLLLLLLDADPPALLLFVFDVVDVEFVAAAPKDAALLALPVLLVVFVVTFAATSILLRRINSAKFLFRVASDVGDRFIVGATCTTLQTGQDPFYFVSHLSIHSLWNICRQRNVRILTISSKSC